jgi:hypothetical protein
VVQKAIIISSFVPFVFFVSSCEIFSQRLGVPFASYFLRAQPKKKTK